MSGTAHKQAVPLFLKDMERNDIRQIVSLSCDTQITLIIKSKREIFDFQRSIIGHLDFTFVMFDEVFPFDKNAFYIFMSASDDEIGELHLADVISFAVFSKLYNPQIMIDELELTNNCNLRCEKCCQTSITIARGFMSQSVFSECLKHLFSGQRLYIHGIGEPFLHPNLFEYLQQLQSAGVYAVMSTNGLLLKPEHIEQILSIGLGKLIISLHCDKSISSLHQLTPYLRQFKDKKIGIRLSAFEPMDSLISKFGRLGVDIEKYAEYIVIDRIISWGGAIYKLDSVDSVAAYQKCYYLKSNAAYVKWNGIVVPCCLDYNNTCSIGNINDFNKITLSKTKHNLCRSCDFGG